MSNRRSWFPLAHCFAATALLVEPSLAQAAGPKTVDECVSISNTSTDPSMQRDDRVFIKNRCNYNVIVLGCVEAAGPPARKFSCSSPRFFGHFGVIADPSKKPRIYYVSGMQVPAGQQAILAAPVDESFSKATVQSASFVACPENAGGSMVRFDKVQFTNGTYKGACKVRGQGDLQPFPFGWAAEELN